MKKIIPLISLFMFMPYMICGEETKIQNEDLFIDIIKNDECREYARTQKNEHFSSSYLYEICYQNEQINTGTINSNVRASGSGSHENPWRFELDEQKYLTYKLDYIKANGKKDSKNATQPIRIDEKGIEIDRHEDYKYYDKYILDCNYTKNEEDKNFEVCKINTTKPCYIFEKKSDTKFNIKFNNIKRNVTCNIGFKQIVLKTTFNYNYPNEYNGNNKQNNEIKEQTYGDNYYLPASPETVIGYNHTEWYKNENENENERIDNKTKVEEREDHELIAKWDQKEYLIKYNNNEGLGEITQSRLIKYYEDFELSDNSSGIIHKQGYKFMGWSRSSTGSVEFNNKAKVSQLIDEDYDVGKNTGVVTLYAVWEQIPPNPPSTVQSSGYGIDSWVNPLDIYTVSTIHGSTTTWSQSSANSLATGAGYAAHVTNSTGTVHNYTTGSGIMSKWK